MTAQPHVPSYWLDTGGPEPEGPGPLAGDRTVEVAVIGGGYTGLAAAYRLAGTHGLDTLVLEAHRIGWGASGRNGGFVGISLGKLGLTERIRKWGLETARRSIEIGVEAVETVRELVAKEQIACDAQPDGWLLVARRPEAVAEVEERVRVYREVLGYRDAEFVDRARLEREGYLKGPSAHGALRFRNAFGLHPMKYVRGLAAAALRRGARLCDRSPVVGWTRDGGWHGLTTPGGTVRARRVVVATNGYTPEGLHPFFHGRVLPATSNIIVTRPLTAAEWREVGVLTTQVYSDTRKLLFYWRRLPDDRLLFGGRAGVINAETTLSRRRRWLEARMADKWPSLGGIGSEYFWYGNVCLSYDLMPHVNTAEGDASVAYAMAYLGSGVAMATYCGGLAGDLVAGKDIPRDTPLTAAGLPRFPLPFLRRAYLAGAYVVYGVEDRWR
ncbi:MAG: FAD-binding oxidoreductase [Candidatus Rokubacteria bacterium]|nr:FAD-binding oxidoreductase [Candidatus Rokubacteria bacterium]